MKTQGEFRTTMRALRRAVLLKALVESGWMVNRAAERLGVHRNLVHRMLKEDDISVKQGRANVVSANLFQEVKMAEVAASRVRLPETRESVTKKFTVGGVKGYVTVGMYADGRPGELFIKLDSVGSTARGFADAWAVLFSMGLQHGVPMTLMLEKARATRFEPNGFTGDPGIPSVSSALDYVARWMEKRFRRVARCEVCGIDFYTMEAGARHDKENLEKHRKMNEEKGK